MFHVAGSNSFGSSVTLVFQPEYSSVCARYSACQHRHLGGEPAAAGLRRSCRDECRTAAGSGARRSIIRTTTRRSLSIQNCGDVVSVGGRRADRPRRRALPRSHRPRAIMSMCQRLELLDRHRDRLQVDVLDQRNERIAVVVAGAELAAAHRSSSNRRCRGRRCRSPDRPCRCAARRRLARLNCRLSYQVCSVVVRRRARPGGFLGEGQGRVPLPGILVVHSRRARRCRSSAWRPAPTSDTRQRRTRARTANADVSECAVMTDPCEGIACTDGIERRQEFPLPAASARASRAMSRLIVGRAPSATTPPPSATSGSSITARSSENDPTAIRSAETRSRRRPDG